MNSIPSASCPVAKHVTSAATNPPALVHAIDSNVDVLAFVTRGLRRFVAVLTRSWSMAVTKSAPRDSAMRPRPKALSSARGGLGLAQVEHDDAEGDDEDLEVLGRRVLPARGDATDHDGHHLAGLAEDLRGEGDVPQRLVPGGHRGICDTPLTRISRIGTSMPVRPNAAHPSAPTTVFTALSTSSTKKVWVNFSPLGPCLVAYTSSCSTANAENAKKIPPTASASFASLCLPLVGPPVAVVAGLDADAPILIDRALALVALSEAMWVLPLRPPRVGKTSRLMRTLSPVLPKAHEKLLSRRVNECAKFAHICSGFKGYILTQKRRFNLLRCFKIFIGEKNLDINFANGDRNRANSQNKMSDFIF